MLNYKKSPKFLSIKKYEQYYYLEYIVREVAIRGSMYSINFFLHFANAIFLVDSN